MSVETSQKVTASQLKRSAFLYVRQSTPRQVLEHTESTARQYALRKRAVALGWQDDQVITIDSDLGQSGASSVDREGFQKLVMEVSMGRAGIVLGLEVSRLARNSTDWHRLLEICALTDTLILDEDGIYHPGDFNDRLLLGLKGTMSEAELHLIRARMRGGVLNKASGANWKRRCRLASPTTMKAGLCWTLISKFSRQSDPYSKRFVGWVRHSAWQSTFACTACAFRA
jgi:DNA invertase Pin-like site-specific DNA recombinase